MTVEEVRELEYKYRTYEEGYDQFNLCPAIDAYIEWHSKALILFSEYFDSQNEDFISFKELDNDRNGYGLHDNFKQIYSRYNLMMHKIEQGYKQDSLANEQQTTKPPMVFISHASTDKTFVEALVHLLETIGFDESNLFCSSIPEYGIGLGNDIYEKLLSIFREKELHVIFIHSPRFYSRSICLNEMGAAWVLKTVHYSILTNDMEFEMMNGVVTPNCIALKVDAEDATARLNEFYDKLKLAFSLNSISQTKWERLRNEFLSKVNSIPYKPLDSNSFSNIDREEYMALSINKMKREEEELKRAYIRGNIIKVDRGYELRIFNSGKATATNVKVEWLNEHIRINLRGDFNIGDLTPQNKRIYYFFVGIGHPNLMHLRYTWADDLKTDNIYEEKLQIT